MNTKKNITQNLCDTIVLSLIDIATTQQTTRPLSSSASTAYLHKRCGYYQAMARDSCWNTIADNCLFVLSEMKKTTAKNFFEQRIERKTKNEAKTPMSLDTIIVEFETL